MTKKGKLTKKDFIAVKKLLAYLKKSEVIRLSGFSRTTVQTFSKLDSWEEYLQFKKEKNELFKEKRRAKKLAESVPKIKTEVSQEVAKPYQEKDYLRDILEEVKETNRLLEKIINQPKKGFFG